MKKLIAAVFAMSFAGAALADGNLGFEIGSNWFRPNYDSNGYWGSGYWWSGQGQNFTLVWGMDNDLWLGAYSEQTTLSDGYGDAYSFDVTAIQVTKGVMKNVNIGMNVGSFYDEQADEVGPLTDVFGKVTILSGSGDKVQGNVNATIGGRWADDSYNGGSNWSGYYVNLSVGLLF